MRKSDQEKVGYMERLENTGKATLSDSMHDEILFWIYDKASNLAWAKDAFKVKFDNFVMHSKNIEMPVYQSTGLRNNYGIKPDKKICGYLDLEVIYKAQVLSKHYDDMAPEKHWSYFVAAVEVKTKVNVGETLRQINFYRNFMSESLFAREMFSLDIVFIVVAPDFTGRRFLEEQGVIFIPYVNDLKN